MRDNKNEHLHRCFKFGPQAMCTALRSQNVRVVIYALNIVCLKRMLKKCLTQFVLFNKKEHEV